MSKGEQLLKPIDYQQIIQDSLRAAIRTILTQVIKDGLKGKQHFYITFITQFPGVELPAYLLEEYPDEMTIILQHEFWDLKVQDHFFSVTLCFDEVYETIKIPYRSITVFSDPSENFEITLDGLAGDAFDYLDSPQQLLDVSFSHPIDKDPQSSEEKGKIIDLNLFRKK